MRLFFAGVFIFLSVLLSVLYLPLTTPTWLTIIVMMMAFSVSIILARKYIHFSFVRDNTIEAEQQFETKQQKNDEQK